MYLQNSFILSLLVLFSVYGILLHNNFDYFSQAENIVNAPAIYGVIVLLQTMFGAPGITEKPKIFNRIQESVVAKFIALYVIAFAVVRDFEDAVFIMIMFLALIQLLRSKEEREAHPNIL